MKLLKKLGAVAAILMVAGGALAQGNYPDKPVRVVITTVPGPLDAFARAGFLTQMGKRLNQTFVVDNKPGAGGNVGSDIVAKAPADGYTLLFALDTTFTVNPSLYPKDAVRRGEGLLDHLGAGDLQPGAGCEPRPFKAASLKEFATNTKSQRITYASGASVRPAT